MFFSYRPFVSFAVCGPGFPVNARPEDRGAEGVETAGQTSLFEGLETFAWNRLLAFFERRFSQGTLQSWMVLLLLCFILLSIILILISIANLFDEVPEDSIGCAKL